MSGHAAFSSAGQIRMSEWGFVFLCVRERGPAPAEPCPDGSHGRTTMAYHYRYYNTDLIWLDL
jgi:hypothetical protein